ncbi:MAG TPA: DMT family transporter [Stellaceae bacterium]|nr:DMT family transporter [Stellaceae bacterium]
MSSAPDLTATAPPRLTLASLLPAVFVLLWSSGFIGAKLGLPSAEPMTFLGLRFVIVTAIMGAASLATGARWPATWREAGHIAVAGLLLQGVYLGGVYIGIAKGVGAGIAALIVGLQPILTAALVRRFLGEEVSPRQWLGFVLGLAGVVLVVTSRTSITIGHVWGVVATVVALFGVTVGMLYQKRFCSDMDLRTGSTIQSAVVAAAMLAGSFTFEDQTIRWTPSFIFALAWLAVPLSVGATLLLYWLLRRGTATRLMSFFYLVPPVTALMAYAAFGESLNPPALLGMGIAVMGVALVLRSGSP